MAPEKINFFYRLVLSSVDCFFKVVKKDVVYKLPGNEWDPEQEWVKLKGFS